MKSSIQIPTSNFSQFISDFSARYEKLKDRKEAEQEHNFLTKIYVTVQLRGPLDLVFRTRINITYNGKAAVITFKFNTIKILLFCLTFCCAIGTVFYIAWTNWFGFVFGGIFAFIIYRSIWNKVILATKKFEKELRRNV